MHSESTSSPFPHGVQRRSSATRLYGFSCLNSNNMDATQRNNVHTWSHSAMLSSVVVSMAVHHVEDLDSIPQRGDTFLFLF